jgi:RING finger family protein
MPEFLLWHFLVLGGTATFAGYWFLVGRHRLFVSELSFRFGGKIIESSGSIWSWKTLALRFLSRNRQVFVEYRYRNLQPKMQIHGELEIRIPLVQKFWLRLLQQNEDEAPTDEITTKIPELDKHYVIHATQEDAAIDFLRRPSVQAWLLRFPILPDRLEIYKGFLRAVINQPYMQKIRREEFETIVSTLLDLADVYEDQQVGLFHVIAATGSQSCPYCRGTFDPSIESIVQCSQCGTLIHQQCWQENGQCTTWGCSSMAVKNQNQNVLTQER